jgi:hypothetical protein
MPLKDESRRVRLHLEEALAIFFQVGARKDAERAGQAVA